MVVGHMKITEMVNDMLNIILNCPPTIFLLKKAMVKQSRVGTLSLVI
jgi:hypothetical protein